MRCTEETWNSDTLREIPEFWGVKLNFHLASGQMSFLSCRVPECLQNLLTVSTLERDKGVPYPFVLLRLACHPLTQHKQSQQHFPRWPQASPGKTKIHRPKWIPISQSQKHRQEWDGRARKWWADGRGVPRSDYGMSSDTLRWQHLWVLCSHHQHSHHKHRKCCFQLWPWTQKWGNEVWGDN